MSLFNPYGSLEYLQDSLTSLLDDVREIQIGRKPNPTDLSSAPLISEWSYGLFPTRCIVGSVLGHPILGNRPRIRTSEIILVDPECGWARTWSRYYRLGSPAQRSTYSKDT